MSAETLIANLEKNIPLEVIQPRPAPPPAAEIQDDYEFSRKTYRDLISKSQEGITALLDLAMASEHPRSFEVLATSLKAASDITDKLMDLQQKKKDLTAESTAKNAAAPTQQLVQNNTYFGTTKALQERLIAQQLAKANGAAPTL